MVSAIPYGTAKQQGINRVGELFRCGELTAARRRGLYPANNHFLYVQFFAKVV